MVQILNKMVHLKYPILQIWCCHINSLLQGWYLTQSWGMCSQTIWQRSSAQVILAGKILHPRCLLKQPRTFEFFWIWYFFEKIWIFWDLIFQKKVRKTCKFEHQKCQNIGEKSEIYTNLRLKISGKTPK